MNAVRDFRFFFGCGRMENKSTCEFSEKIKGKILIAIYNKKMKKNNIRKRNVVLRFYSELYLIFLPLPRKLISNIILEYNREYNFQHIKIF